MAHLILGFYFLCFFLFGLWSFTLTLITSKDDFKVTPSAGTVPNYKLYLFSFDF